MAANVREGAASALAALLAVREREEQRAERALTDAAAARERAEAELARLRAEAEGTRTELAARRCDDASPETLRAADVLGQRRFLERIESRMREQVAAAAAFVLEHVQPTRRAEEAARAAHLRARTRREIVGRAIARREATRRRELERRAEAAVDDSNGRGAKDPRDLG